MRLPGRSFCVMPVKKKDDAEAKKTPARKKTTKPAKIAEVKTPEDLIAVDTIPQDIGEVMPEPHEFLSETQRDGEKFEAADIYRETWEQLKKLGCASLVSRELLERYAVSTARWRQCEAMTTRLGFLSKHPTSGKPVTSPYVEMGIDYMNQSLRLWDEISKVIKAYSETEMNDAGASMDLMGKRL